MMNNCFKINCKGPPYKDHLINISQSGNSAPLASEQNYIY